MDTAITAITSFLVSGAAIVAAGHIALTINGLRGRLSKPSDTAMLAAIAAELHTHASSPQPAPAPRFEMNHRMFHGFDSPPGRF